MSRTAPGQGGSVIASRAALSISCASIEKSTCKIFFRCVSSLPFGRRFALAFASLRRLSGLPDGKMLRSVQLRRERSKFALRGARQGH